MRNPSRLRKLALPLAGALAISVVLGGLLLVFGGWLAEPPLQPGAAGGPEPTLIAGFTLLLAGVAAAAGFFGGAWQRLSLFAGVVVLLIAIWSLSGTPIVESPSNSAKSLSLPAAFTFLLLSVGTLSLRAGSRLGMAVTGLTATLALLTSLYELAAYAYWLQDPNGRVLLLATSLQTIALQALLALALLSYFAHTFQQYTSKIPALVLGSYTLMALICTAGWAYFNHTERGAVLEQTAQSAANVSRVLEEHVYRSLDPIDLLFAELQRQVENRGLESIIRSREQWQILSAAAEALPQVSAFLIFDAEGEFRSFSRQFPAPGGNYSFREYFQAHQAGESRYLGELVAAGTTGKPIFTYSHRLTDSAGNFAGVAIASLEIDYFQAFYRSLEPGDSTALGLFRRDGKLLMREPLPVNIAGQHLDQHPIYTTLIHQSPTGTFVGRSPYDGEQKLAYYLASDGLPFVINTLVGMDDVVVLFERRLMQSTAVLALIFAVLTAMMLIQLRAIERRALANAQARKNQRFTQAVLDSVSSAILIVSPSGEIVSTNSAWHGFSRDNGAGDLDDWFGLDYLTLCQRIHGEHGSNADAIAAGLAAVIAGEKREFEHIYPLSGPDAEHWYRMKVVPMSDGSGRAVISHESITTLKQAEAALKVAANTDLLTGLNNRRAVIEQAERHLANVRRHQLPLSLMMIDCDHFKGINDTFGHAGGDAVLRTLGQIMHEVCRAEDLLGRFGGEEFVAVLPYASQEGAKDLAERLRQAAEEARVQDDQGIITFTISIGVATLRPGMSFEDLLKEADNALYRAKANGRNRVETTPSGNERKPSDAV